MKTRLIDELSRAPASFTGKRIAVNHPVTTSEQSEITSTEAGVMEEYRFEARFGATFLCDSNVPRSVRNLKYELMLRTVTEQIYGEVRAEAHRIFQHLSKIDDRDTHDQLWKIAGDILEMTKP